RRPLVRHVPVHLHPGANAGRGHGRGPQLAARVRALGSNTAGDAGPAGPARLGVQGPDVPVAPQGPLPLADVRRGRAGCLGRGRGDSVGGVAAALPGTGRPRAAGSAGRGSRTTGSPGGGPGVTTQKAVPNRLTWPAALGRQLAWTNLRRFPRELV